MPDDTPASIRIVVERVRVEGNGAILLTGPSSCGKGEIAKSISSVLSLSNDHHVSMGDVLRQTIERASTDEAFRDRLGREFGIRSDVSIFDVRHNPIDLMDKARRYEDQIRRCRGDGGTEVSQLDWLSFCVRQGLLIPDGWAEAIIAAHFRKMHQLHDGIFVLDGYPRTTVATQKLLKTFKQLGIGIIKVIHLSITKEQMKLRAENRGRGDDIEEALNRRYQFYVEKVQPCIDSLKMQLGQDRVVIIDAHQPVFRKDGRLNLNRSILAVTTSVIEALGLPNYLLDIKNP
ncbi:MAG: nucleoside monophosphate kinase [Candidatus Latescibacterota bacterium]|nr:nucleoside monophosphate kinase [Candidatus Latescibacterota bacterium]